MIVTYFDQLRLMAHDRKVPLRRAFIAAGVADTTRLRALKGTDLHIDTAKRVAHAIVNWKQPAAA
jgi:hypothetical protein